MEGCLPGLEINTWSAHGITIYNSQAHGRVWGMMDSSGDSSNVSGCAGARFSVVIVNYNGGSMLLECVLSAVREGVPASQIIVVDNGSRDDSMQALESHVAGARVVRNNCNAGFARAVNQGIGLATAEFILLLNNDAQLEPGALQAFAEGFDTFPNLAIAGGQLHYPDGRLQSAFAPFPSLAEEILPLILLQSIFPDRFRRKTAEETPVVVESVLGACLCVRNSILPKLGLLDEDYFFFFEEIDWCRRAWQMAAQVYYLPKARAWHRQGHTANRFRGPSRVEYQRSKLTFFKKTRRPAAFLALSAWLAFRTFINAASGAVMCAATLGLNKRLRLKAWTYAYVFCWHALCRPASWGLPGKCAGQGDLQAGKVAAQPTPC
jgi:GT2 family glycosyltransferase